jgi:hypothetical protein
MKIKIIMKILLLTQKWKMEKVKRSKVKKNLQQK